MYLCSSRAQKDGLHRRLGGWRWWRFDRAVDCATHRRGGKARHMGEVRQWRRLGRRRGLGGVNTSAGGGG